MSQEREDIAIYPCLPSERLIEICFLFAGCTRSRECTKCKWMWGSLRNQLLNTMSLVMPYQPYQSVVFDTALWIRQDSFPPSSKMPADNAKHLYIPELKNIFLNYVFKCREIVLLLLITRHFLQNIYASKGCTNFYFTLNYWIATITILEKVCK